MSITIRAWILFSCLIATLPSTAMSAELSATSALTSNASATATLDAISALDAVASASAVGKEIHFVPNS